jgi:two-component system phosphate regulon sensor histidine kinase PhoR
MRKRYFLFTALIVILSLIATTTVSFLLQRNSYINQTKQNLSAMISVVTFNQDNINQNYQDIADQFNIDDITKNYRLTIISKDGTVLAESSDVKVREMESHGTRPEIVEASDDKNDYGYDIRYSNTLGISYLYVAKYISHQNIFIRISVPLSHLNELQREYILLLIIALLAGILVAIIMVYPMSKNLLLPIKKMTKKMVMISSGNYDVKLEAPPYIELKGQVRSFNNMAKSLKTVFGNLNEKNAQLDSVVNSVQESILLVDKDNNILFANKKAHDLVQGANLKSQNINAVIRTRAISKLIKKCIENNKIVSCEMKTNRSILYVVACPVESGESQQVLLTIKDITHMRKLENVRREFVSNVTHELKTPLTSISGFVETIKSNPDMDDETRNKFLEIIEIESDRLQNLINDILLLSEIENEPFATDVQDVDITKVVSDVEDILSPTAHEKGVEIVSSLDRDITIRANYNRIKQILMNLLDNAIKYNKKDGKVFIKANTNGDIATISVKDTGIGIPQDNLERLFERFYRVDKGRSRQMGGTGLGLSIVKHIVGMYNGDINITSTLGEGTEVTLKLPIN